MTWLHLSMSEDVIFTEERWLTRVLHDLVNSVNQCLSVILFIRHHYKNLVFCEFFLSNNIKKTHQTEFVNLQVDISIIINNFLVLFADSDSSLNLTSASSSQCHDIWLYILHWTTTDTSVFNLLHAWFLCLFTDVICIFAEDFNNLNNVMNHFWAWTAAESSI